MVISACPIFPGATNATLLTFAAIASDRNTNLEVLDCMEREIARLKADRVAQDELQRAKRRVLVDVVHQLADNPVLAGELAFFEACTGDCLNLFRRVDRIQAVRPDDIQRVASTAFAGNNKIVGMIERVQ